MRRYLAAIALIAAAVPGQAQEQSRAERWMQNCDYQGRRDSEQFCEVRDTTLPVGQRLHVDARENGSIRFYGWARNEVRVRMLLASYGDTQAEAQRIAKEVRIVASPDRVYADGPSSRRYSGWHASFEVWVPRRMNIEGITSNGGVTVDGVEGRMELRAVNGGIHLTDVAGDVRAETTNGSVNATLTGATWKGNYLDMETTNGSVNLEVPRGFNADLETGTVNGGMHIDFPITVQGSFTRRINTKLGNGGPRVRAVTTNGAVRIRETR